MMSPTDPRSASRPPAFTLIELLVAMAIIGILGAAVAPIVGRWIEDYRVRAASRQLMSDIQFARMRAVADKVQYQVYFNPANNQYWVQQVERSRRVDGLEPDRRHPPAFECGKPGVRGRRDARLRDERRQDRHLFAHGRRHMAWAATLTASLSSTNYQRNVAVATTGRVQIVQVRP